MKIVHNHKINEEVSTESCPACKKLPPDLLETPAEINMDDVRLAFSRLVYWIKENLIEETFEDE